MSTMQWDAGMQPAVRLGTADCEDFNSLSSLRLQLPANSAAFVNLPPIFCPAMSLQHHGYLHWIITGVFISTANAANAVKFRPHADAVAATGAVEMVFTPGASGGANTCHFIFEAKMCVAHNTNGDDKQVWKATLSICQDGVNTPVYEDSFVNETEITQTAAHDIGWGALCFTGGTCSIDVRSVTCTHVGQRNGT